MLPYSAKSRYVLSARLMPDGGRPQPDPAQVAILVERIGSWNSRISDQITASWHDHRPAGTE